MIKNDLTTLRPADVSRFVDEYCVDLDPVAAAARAEFRDPDGTGRALMARADVQDAIRATMDRRATRIQVQQDYVLRRLLMAERADPLKIQRWVFDPCRHCLAGDTLILMADGRSLPLSAIRVGDRIIGTRQGLVSRDLVETEVLAHWRTVKSAFELSLEDGRKIIGSDDHRLLVNWTRHAPRYRWKQIKEIRRGLKIVGCGTFIQTPPETEDYRRGYLSGVIRGDGHLGKHHDHGSKTAFQYFFRLAMRDGEAIRRAKRYLAFFGIEVSEFSYVMNGIPASAIRTGGRIAFSAIEETIAWRDSKEYRRGYVAGLFDAEGSGKGVLRVVNQKQELLSLVERALSEQGFKYLYDVDKECKNGTLRCIRITGGFDERIRFFQWNDPSIKRKLNLEETAFRRSFIVESVRPIGLDIPMYDITTGTGDFIANGLVAHNCWGRDHRYQLTDYELAAAVAAYRGAYLAGQEGEVSFDRTGLTPLVDRQVQRAWNLGRALKELPAFDDLGGSGFTPFREPCRGPDFVAWEIDRAEALGWGPPTYAKTNDHTCPVCWGYGIKRLVVRDVENLGPAERLLVKGFKNTPTGVQIELRDQDHLREVIAKHLGMFVERHAVLLAEAFDPETMTDEQLDAILVVCASRRAESDAEDEPLPRLLPTGEAAPG